LQVVLVGTAVAVQADMVVVVLVVEDMAVVAVSVALECAHYFVVALGSPWG
jgi:hypothetical protein